VGRIYRAAARKNEIRFRLDLRRLFEKERTVNAREAVRTLLAVREYDDRPIAEESVRRILEAAQLTGSSRNRQQWDFVAIQDKQTLQRIGASATTGKFIAGAALAIAVIVPDNTTGYIDGARAVQDMMLVAWEEGIGSCWVGNCNTPEIRGLLNVPDDRLVLTVVPFGYPAKKLGKGRKNRKPLSEIAHAETFGSRFSPA
jgi:nitroreductase